MHSYYEITGLIPDQRYLFLDSEDPQYKLEVAPGVPGELQFVATSTDTRIKVTLPPPADFSTDISIDVVPEYWHVR